MKEINLLLKKYGVAPHFLGYKYLGEAIKLVQLDDTVLHKITKILYPTIAKNYNTTAIRVERAIRFAKEQAYSKLNDEVIKELFGNTLKAGEIPTNTHFIATMVEILEEKE